MSAPLPRAAGYDALALAWASWLLEADQMPLTLPPAPRNNPALASATNAMRSVYSIRSWPCSSYQRFAMWSILGLRPLRTITASMQQLQDIEGDSENVTLSLSDTDIELRHSREMTLLCSPRVTHNHTGEVALLPPGQEERPGNLCRTGEDKLVREK